MPSKIRRKCPNPGCNRDIVGRLQCEAGRGCRARVTPYAQREAQSQAQVRAQKPQIIVDPSQVPNQVPLTRTLGGSQAQAQPQTKLLTNHIAILLDSSGSMDWLQQPAISYFNEQLLTIRREAANSGQRTTLSLATFGERSDSWHLKHLAVRPEAVPPLDLRTYTPAANTPMVKCMLGVLPLLTKLPDSGDPNTSFLVLMLTDGQENASRAQEQSQLATLIKQLSATDRWTFAAAGPEDAKQLLLELGVPVGNFTAWEQSEQGMRDVTSIASAGIGSYYTDRGMGQTMSKSFFETNVANVSQQAIHNLQDRSNEFRRLSVAKDIDILSFIGGLRIPFQKGRGFYELTKTESIQSYKEMILVHNKTGAMHGGVDAKMLLGLPLGGTIKVRPGQHGDYKVFVQSTSNNRKLISGTELLWKLA